MGPYKKPLHPKQRKHPPTGYMPQAWAASIEEMDEDTNNKEIDREDEESYQESYQKSQSDNISSLTAHTAKLTEGQWEVWLDKMKQLGINI